MVIHNKEQRLLRRSLEAWREIPDTTIHTINPLSFRLRLSVFIRQMSAHASMAATLLTFSYILCKNVVNAFRCIPYILPHTEAVDLTLLSAEQPVR